MHSGARADPPARRLLALFNINTLHAMAVPCLLRGLRPARPFFLIVTRFSPQLERRRPLQSGNARAGRGKH